MPAETIAALATIIVSGPVSIFVTQVLKRAAWSNFAKMLLSIAVCVVFGVAQAYIDGALSSHTVTFPQVVTATLAVFAAAQAEYEMVFRGKEWMSRVETWLDSSTSA